MNRKKIVEIFKEKGIDLSPAGIWKRDDDSGKKVAIDAKRKDGLSWDSCKQDNILKYRAETNNLLICDFDDLKLVSDSKLFSAEWIKKFNDTFRYFTTSKNKMHCVFTSDIEIPKTRKTGNSSFCDGLDVITNGVVFTGHFYSSDDTEFKIFNNEIIHLSADEVDFFVGYESAVDSDDGFGKEVGFVAKPKRDNWSLVGEGGRNDELFRSICSELSCNVDKETIKNNALEWNTKLSNPLDSKEVIATFESAVKLDIKNYPNGHIKKSDDKGFDILTDLDIQTWFDINMNKYAIKQNDEFWFLDKGSFKQRLSSYTGEKISEDFLIQLPSFKSEYNPQNKDFFTDSNNHGVVNLFRPSELMNIGSDAKSEVMPINIRRLLFNLFSNDMDSLNVFLNWLACIYQKRIKTGVSWAFVGNQGTGKGLLVETVLHQIFGNHLRLNVTDTLLSGQFNGWLENKLIIQLNEISTDYKSRIAVKNKIKTWITDSYIEVERKGIDSRDTLSFANFIINSNEEIPLDLDDDDRRFNVIHSTIKLRECDWFTESYINDLKSECRAFSEFLNGYKIDLNKVNDVVLSRRKKQIIESSRSIDYDIGYRIKIKDIEWFELDDENITESIKNEFKKSFISNKHIEFLYNEIHGSNLKSNTIKKILARHINIGDDTVVRIDGKIIRGVFV